MNNKKSAIAFTILAGISLASVAPIAAMPSARPNFIVLPLALMGIFLFFVGYYCGLSKSK